MSVHVAGIKSNNQTKYVELPVEGLWTRVRFPPPPPFTRARKISGPFFLPEIPVGKKELLGQLVLQPSAGIASTFNRLAANLDSQIENLDSQNRELAKARDLLLPKLMTGQLDVSGIRPPEEVAA